MTGRLRYVLAAAFVALFVLFPTADRERIAFLQTKKWVTGQLDSGLEAHTAAGRTDAFASRLQVDYRAQGSTDASRIAQAEDYERILREWARGQDIALDPATVAHRLSVVVGANGFESTLVSPHAEPTDAAPNLRMLETDDPERPRTAGSYYPDRWSLLPAFLAIILAILTGKVIPALLIGSLAGAIRFAGSIGGGADHLTRGTIWEDVFQSQFNLEILGFVFFLFMAVGVMARSGGIRGMVNIVSRFARGPVSTQICSWVIGVLIFFDDYSNCIIAGTTMRPLTDRVGVAREKLAYIVDSTAAPIAGVSIFSTWVAYEVSMFAPQLPEVTHPDGTPYAQSEGFSVFVQTLPLRFYCLFTLIMVLATIVLRREFGPMRRAAERASHEGKPTADDAKPMVADSLTSTEPPPGAPLRAVNALLPLTVLILTTMALIYSFGNAALSDGMRDAPWMERIPAILGNGESQRALCIAAAAAFVVAVLLAVGQRILSLGDALGSALRSAKALLFAMIILVLAWTIGAICGDLGTAQFLTAAFHGSFGPWMLPAIMFALASLVAFSTGTSYGTMSILLPNVVVLAHTMGNSDPDLGGSALMLLTIGAVLEGSIFGDHCSPISDTTVLSSVATASDHMHHVRTQAPYAVFAMVVSMVCGYLPVALLGADAWPLAWGLGTVAIVVALLVFGRNPYRNAPATES